MTHSRANLECFCTVWFLYEQTGCLSASKVSYVQFYCFLFKEENNLKSEAIDANSVGCQPESTDWGDQGRDEGTQGTAGGHAIASNTHARTHTHTCTLLSLSHKFSLTHNHKERAFKQRGPYSSRGKPKCSPQPLWMVMQQRIHEAWERHTHTQDHLFMAKGWLVRLRYNELKCFKAFDTQNPARGKKISSSNPPP